MYLTLLTLTILCSRVIATGRRKSCFKHLTTMPHQSDKILMLRKPRWFQHSCPVLSTKPSCLMVSRWKTLTSLKPRFYVHCKWKGHRRDPKQDYSCPSRLLFLVAVWNIVAYKADERMLAVFDNDRIRRILHVRQQECVQEWQNCGTTSASLAYWLNSSKEGFAGLAILRGVLRVDWSGTSSRPHRLARGPRHSRKTCYPTLDRESTTTHDCEMTGWTSLVNPHSTIEPPSVIWSTWLMIIEYDWWWMRPRGHIKLMPEVQCIMISAY